MKQFLLCTDLDRTLIPNGTQPASPEAKARFKRLVAREDVTLAYVSGRHRALIEQAIEEFDLPIPDFAIADVGSTIYQIDASGLNQWGAWDAQIAPDWGGLSSNNLCKLLSSFPLLKQEKEKQNLHKLSFYVPLETETKKLIPQIEAHLKQANIKANLIWSVDEAAEIGLLDVLPASANKLHAIRFLMQQKGYDLSHTVFAGDSGNDMDVILSDIPAVLVANAHADVKAQAGNAHKDTLYIARGGYLGMNGNYSAGILEGVAHYWPEMDAWMREQN